MFYFILRFSTPSLAKCLLSWSNHFLFATFSIAATALFLNCCLLFCRYFLSAMFVACFACVQIFQPSLWIFTSSLNTFLSLFLQFFFYFLLICLNFFRIHIAVYSVTTDFSQCFHFKFLLEAIDCQCVVYHLSINYFFTIFV